MGRNSMGRKFFGTSRQWGTISLKYLEATSLSFNNAVSTLPLSFNLAVSSTSYFDLAVSRTPMKLYEDSDLFDFAVSITLLSLT
jgi:hypothetical protein